MWPTVPIYAYKCSACGFSKDALRKISDPPLTTCPECGQETFNKQVTAAGFQLKGSGWYVTDFRNNGSAPPPATGAAPKVPGADQGASQGSDSSGASDGAAQSESANSKGSSAAGEKSGAGQATISNASESGKASGSAASASDGGGKKAGASGGSGGSTPPSSPAA